MFQVMREKSKEMDMEIHFKDAFRAFSKDDEGECLRQAGETGW